MPSMSLLLFDRLVDTTIRLARTAAVGSTPFHPSIHPSIHSFIHLHKTYTRKQKKLNALEGVDQLAGELALLRQRREAEAHAHVAVQEDGLVFVL
jgi:hypothetical protein